MTSLCVFFAKSSRNYGMFQTSKLVQYKLTILQSSLSCCIDSLQKQMREGGGQQISMELEHLKIEIETRSLAGGQEV
jgi:hypothetical protein